MLFNSPAGQKIVTRVLNDEETIHVPHLIDLEVAQVLRRYVRTRDLSASRSAQALEDFLSLPLTRYPHEPLLQRIWDLRSHFTAYDAAYIALAEALNAPLITCDGRLGRSSGHEAKVEVF